MGQKLFGKTDQTQKYTRLQTKFLMGLAAIMVLFSALASTTIYYFQKMALEDEAYQKTEIVMMAMAANRSYVREVLRPIMYATLAVDKFILEAMSSSYISRSVMERFNKNLYNFTYRRVATNARNPNYEANQREVEMIKFFSDNPQVEEWKGIEVQEETRYFMRYRPVYAEQSCTRCHGIPGKAPKEIIELYGDSRGFYLEAGNIYGVMSVGLPVDLSLQKIKDIAITVFLGVLPSILFLYTVISVFFNKVIVQNLNTLLDIFRTNLQEEKYFPRHNLTTDSRDEIDELISVAQTMAVDLQVNKEKLENYAARILQSKELLQSVFDGITDPVVLVNSNSVIRNVNKAFIDRYGLKLEQVIDTALSEISFTRSCPLVECADIFSSFPDKPISRQKHMDGGEIYLIHFYPIRDNHDGSAGIVCYVKDITEQKRMESKIQHTEKIVSLGQMAAGVAHEINNPLGVILCHVDLIKDDPNLSVEAKADIEVIEKHAGNCKKIVADMLNFSRQHKSMKEFASMNAILQDVALLAANQFQQQNITVDLDLDSRAPMINVDVDKLKQVFFNLLINSGQAIEEDGYILCSSKYDDQEHSLSLIIEDNGCGIDPQILDKIFDPFFTTKEPGKGTGLGLAVSYGIMKDHDGDILVESVPEKGTRFTVKFSLQGASDG